MVNMKQIAATVKESITKKPNYRLLHIPSGEYLKLYNSGYGMQESPKKLFGYTSLAKMLETLLNSSEIVIQRHVELLTKDGTPVVVALEYPGTDRVFKTIPLYRIDVLRGTDDEDNMFPFTHSWQYDTQSSKLEAFKKDPNYIFCSGVISEEDVEFLDSTDYFTYSSSYKIQINNTSSWDDILLELFKYLQSTGYYSLFSQFSKDKATKQKVYLSEFEIVSI